MDVYHWPCFWPGWDEGQRENDHSLLPFIPGTQLVWFPPITRDQAIGSCRKEQAGKGECSWATGEGASFARGSWAVRTWERVRGSWVRDRAVNNKNPFSQPALPLVLLQFHHMHREFTPGGEPPYSWIYKGEQDNGLALLRNVIVK